MTYRFKVRAWAGVVIWILRSHFSHQQYNADETYRPTETHQCLRPHRCTWHWSSSCSLEREPNDDIQGAWRSLGNRAQNKYTESQWMRQCGGGAIDDLISPHRQASSGRWHDHLVNNAGVSHHLAAISQSRRLKATSAHSRLADRTRTSPRKHAKASQALSACRRETRGRTVS